MPTPSVRAYYEYRDDRPTELQIDEGESLTFPPHLHSDLELFLVQSGCIRVMVGDAFSELTANSLAVIFPNTIHSYTSLTPGSRFSMAVCRQSLWGNFLSQLTHSRPVCPFLSGDDLHPDIPYAMHGLFLQEQEGPDNTIYRALVQLILARVLSRMQLEPVQEPTSTDLTVRLVQYLARNFQQPLSLDSLAKALNVSKYHLSHVFSSRLHTSFSEYLHFLRLNAARELLRTTNQSILEIGLNCGFSSQRTFNRVFQQYFGISPRDFRSQNKAGL